MNINYLSNQKGKLCYIKHGKGKKNLLAFHGFGQDKSIFSSWISQIEEIYTLYAFDLFYHGNSVREKKFLTKDEWGLFLKDFLSKEQILSFHVLGYSIGARFALVTAFQHAQQVESLILIAPDGIHLSPWVRMANMPFINHIFKYLMSNPKKLIRGVNIIKKFGLIDSYRIDFIKKEMMNKQKCYQIFLSWRYFNTLLYKKKDLIARLNKLNVNKRIILGKNDPIVQPRKILPILKKINFIQINTLPLKHHRLLGKEAISLITEKLWVIKKCVFS